MSDAKEIKVCGLIKGFCERHGLNPGFVRSVTIPSDPTEPEVLEYAMFDEEVIRGTMDGELVGKWGPVGTAD